MPRPNRFLFISYCPFGSRLGRVYRGRHAAGPRCREHGPHHQQPVACVQACNAPASDRAARPVRATMKSPEPTKAGGASARSARPRPQTPRRRSCPWCRADARRARAAAAPPRAIMSRSSRRRMSASTSASSTGSPRPRNSSARRRARTSGVAVTKIFTSASGQITVPMSRPSSTAPGGGRRSCAANRAAPRAPPGSPRPRDAASPMAWLFSAASSNAAGSSARAAATARAWSLGRMAGVEHRLRHRAIEQPGVEMAKPVVRGEPLAERALAGSGRSVDGDDHEKSAPSERIIATKSGKLVAMKAASSTLTGCSLAEPHHQRRHGDAVIHVGGDEAAAGGTRPCPARSDRRPRSRPRRR